MKRWLLALVLACCTSANAELRDPNEHFFQPFLGSLQAELDTARNAGKKGVLLVFEMEECPFCERFHRTTLRHSEVQDLLGRHFVILRIDVRGATPVTGFDGADQTEARFSVSQRVRATPTSVFYDLKGVETARFTGPSKDAAEFLLFAHFVISGAARSQSFAEFRASTRP